MSTNDVPGFKDEKTGKSKHNDELAMGCWAEHEDGSLIFVESVEDGRVVYCVFELDGPDPIEYRDAMAERGFKKAFSWSSYQSGQPRDESGKFAKKDFAVPWTWHDKTPFPWDRVIGKGARATRFASADAVINAAERVAKHRKLRGRKFDYDSALTKAGTIGRTIRDKLQRAIGELRR